MSLLGRRIGRWRHRGEPRAFILRYHRVADLTADPNRLAIRAEAFAEHLALIAARWRPRPLAELAADLAAGRLEDRSVAVTFDDGYLDVVQTARPLLARHGVPATVFVVADMMSSEREFWWDELERVCFASSERKTPLDLTVGGRRIVSNGDSAEGTRLFGRLHSLIKPLPSTERDATLDRLMTWAGVDPAPRPTHRVIDRAELGKLAGDPVLVVGGHTRSHPSLGKLGPDQQWDEIEGGKRILESALGGPVSTFAFPFGAGRKTAGLVARAGFRAAVTTDDGPVFRATDRFRLPRIHPGAGGADSLARLLESWS